MAPTVPNNALDAQLDAIEGTRIHITSAEPANYAGIAAVELAAADISGSYTKADGDVSGRKTTCPGQTAIPITADGNGAFCCISNGTDTLLSVYNILPIQALVTGGTVNTNPFDHEIEDPVQA